MPPIGAELSLDDRYYHIPRLMHLRIPRSTHPASRALEQHMRPPVTPTRAVARCFEIISLNIQGARNRIEWGAIRRALDELMDDERWGEALAYNSGIPMPHENE